MQIVSSFLPFLFIYFKTPSGIFYDSLKSLYSVSDVKRWQCQGIVMRLDSHILGYTVNYAIEKLPYKENTNLRVLRKGMFVNFDADSEITKRTLETQQNF